MAQTGFYTWTAVAVLMLLLIFKNHNTPAKAIGYYLLVCTAWLCYIAVLSTSGVLENLALPPRLPLLIVIPTIIASILVTRSQSFQSVLRNSQAHLPVYLQSFRIGVELLIYSASLNGIFPRIATFEGLNFDIVMGSSALIMGRLIQTEKVGARALLAWNIGGLMILSLTVYAFISTYYFTDYAATAGSWEFVRFPYILLASVLLPIAIFLHTISIRQAVGVIRETMKINRSI